METPTLPLRNEKGLYDNVEYHYKPNGKVDWRKMVPSEFIVPNLEKTKETDITKIDDKDLLILLEGFKYLLNLRGYTNVDTIITPGATDSFVSAVTSITWIPNYETEGLRITRTGAADAHYGSTKGDFQNFLTAIAENRSFVRAVRFFLEIPILGKDEMRLTILESQKAEQKAESTQSAGFLALQDLITQNSIKFENLKNKMIKLKIDGADLWQSLDDIPDSQILDVIDKTKAVIAAFKARKEAEAKAKTSE